MVEKNIRIEERIAQWGKEYCKSAYPNLHANNPLHELIEHGVVTRIGNSVSIDTPADEIQRIIDDMVLIGGEMGKAAVVLHVENMVKRNTIKEKIRILRKRGLEGIGRSKYFELLSKAKIYIMARLQERIK